MATTPDFGPNRFTITLNGTTISNHAPVEGLIGGNVVNSQVYLTDYGINHFANFTVVGTTPSQHAPVGLFSRLVCLSQIVPVNITVLPNTQLPSDALFRRARFFKEYKKWDKPWIVPNRKRNFFLSLEGTVARTTWAGLEIVHAGNAGVRVTWAGVEIVHSGNAGARATWAGIEVVRAIASAPVLAFRRLRHPWVYRAARHHPHPRKRFAFSQTTMRRPVVFVTA